MFEQISWDRVKIIKEIKLKREFGVGACRIMTPKLVSRLESEFWIQTLVCDYS